MCATTPSRAQSARAVQRRRPRGLRRACAVLLACLAAGCTDPAPADAVDKPLAADAQGGCAPVARAPDGCCPDGSFYDFGAGACQSAGPFGCAQSALDQPSDCVPRWCWSWRDRQDAPCTAGSNDCWPQGRSCDADERAGMGGCGAGTAPEASGACAAVGPRAAASIAVSGADGALAPIAELAPAAPPQLCAGPKEGQIALCEPGVKGCPSGSLPDDSGGCASLGPTWSCPPGFVADAKLAGAAVGALPPCRPDPADCGAGPYAPDLASAAGSGPTVYVDANAPAGGDGSLTQPLKSLTAAVKLAQPQATIALAAGTYSASIQLGQSQRIVGRCAHLVHIDGDNTTATVIIAATKAVSVELQGLRIGGVGVGIAATNAVNLKARKLWIRKARVAGVAVFGAGVKALLEDSVVADTRPEVGTNKYGVGVDVSDAAQMALVRVRLRGNINVGLSVSKLGSLATASDLLIDATQPQAQTGSNGYGLQLQQQGRATLERVRLRDHPAAAALLRHAGTLLQARDLRVEGGAAPSGKQVPGEGVVVLLGSRAELTGAEVTGCAGQGVGVDDPGSRLLATGLKIQGTLPDADGGRGYGLKVATGARADLIGLHIDDSRATGMGADGGGTVLNVTGALVAHTAVEAGTGWLGNGVVYHQGATGVLNRVRIGQAARAGLHVGGGQLTAIDLTVQGCGIGDVAAGGIWVQDGATVSLQNARLSQCADRGLTVNGEGTSVSATRLVVDRTGTEASAEDSGTGIALSGGGALRLDDARLHANHTAALEVWSGATATVRDLVVDGTRPLTAKGVVGMAVRVAEKGRLWLHGGWLHDNTGLTVGVEGPQSLAALSSVRISATRAEPASGRFGLGLQVHDGARLLLSGAQVTDNRFAGVVVSQAQAVLSGVQVRRTAPDGADGQHGVGIGAIDGARVQVQGCLVVDSHVSGLMFQGAEGSVVDSAVRDTQLASYFRPGPGQARPLGFGDGLLAYKAGDLQIVRSLFTGNARAGLLLDACAKVALRQSVASGNIWGVVQQHGSDVTQDGSALHGNSVANASSDAALNVPPPPAVSLQP